jgi:hypothetical protein
MAATLRPGRVFQDLGQFAHQHIAIARVFIGDPDPRDRAGISAAAEGHDVPGSTAATDVHATDQRIVVQAPRFALLRFLDALAVDELEFVSGRRKAADTGADEVAVDAVRLNPFLDQSSPESVPNFECRG